MPVGQISGGWVQSVGSEVSQPTRSKRAQSECESVNGNMELLVSDICESGLQGVYFFSAGRAGVLGNSQSQGRTKTRHLSSV